ncbi:MAG: hypothetical protein KDD45_10825, partial [Bdellovibrionales bacterium]|nr:hypothetical protein [Bdellovibrionales bacterium]
MMTQNEKHISHYMNYLNETLGIQHILNPVIQEIKVPVNKEVKRKVFWKNAKDLLQAEGAENSSDSHSEKYVFINQVIPDSR